MPDVEIDLTARHGGTVKIDGHDVSHLVVALSVRATVEKPRYVTLRLMPKSLRVKLAGAQVRQYEMPEPAKA